MPTKLEILHKMWMSLEATATAARSAFFHCHSVERRELSPEAFEARVKQLTAVADKAMAECEAARQAYLARRGKPIPAPTPLPPATDEAGKDKDG